MIEKSAFVEFECDLPLLPNYIRVRGPGGHGELVIDIAQFSNARLRLIGKAWTEALVAQAAKRRKRKART